MPCLQLMSSIPLYFQITQRDSPGKAGSYLVSAVVGNTIGALLTGIYIKKYPLPPSPFTNHHTNPSHRNGKYKLPTIISGLSQILAYTLLILRWQGHTNFWESLYVFGGGFGLGASYSALFIALAASVTEEEFPIAGSGLYMFSSIGSVTGISISGTVFKWFAKKGLLSKLSGVKGGTQVRASALSC